MRYVIAVLLVTAACNGTGKVTYGPEDSGAKLVFTPPEPPKPAVDQDIKFPGPDGGVLTDPGGFERVWDTGCAAKGDRAWQPILAKQQATWKHDADGGLIPPADMKVDPKVIGAIIDCIEHPPAGVVYTWPK